jgi:hypothetical protein
MKRTCLQKTQTLMNKLHVSYLFDGQAGIG